MARIINFFGKSTVEPGAYAGITNGATPPPVLGTSGNVLMIDTGIGRGYGWGAGIDGENSDGADSIYIFEKGLDAKKALRGGILYDLMDYLWSPSNGGNGIERLIYARAAVTEAAKINMAFSSGAVEVVTKNEGAGGNGEVNVSSQLVLGYSTKLRAGTLDSSKFVLELYEGQYRGQDIYNNSAEYETAKTEIKDNLVVQSIEFSSTEELILWMTNDYMFNLYFSIGNYTAVATALIAADITNFGSHNLFIDGTATYSSLKLDEVLANCEDLDFSLMLCTDSGVVSGLSQDDIDAGINKGAQAVENTKILSFLNNNATYPDICAFVGGGDKAGEFVVGTSGSLDIAALYDDEKMVVVHSGVKVPNHKGAGGVNYKYLPSLYHSAMVCGLHGGIEPQVPGTYKSIRIIGLRHELKKTEREKALFGGVLHTRYVASMGWVINQSINSLQQNANMINADGSTSEISIVRIKHQLNKELMMNATIRFVGGNLNTASATEVKAFTEDYLQTRTAERLNDNLIIRSEKVEAVLDTDVWRITYCFIANSPINRLFFTGYMLDPNILNEQNN